MLQRNAGGKLCPSQPYPAGSSPCPSTFALEPTLPPPARRRSAKSGYACATNRSSTRYSRNSRNEQVFAGLAFRVWNPERPLSNHPVAESRVRRRLLLVRRGGVREGTGRDLGRLGLHRRQDEESDLRAGLLGRHGPYRSGGGDLRPGKGKLRQAARHLLGQRRPGGHRSPVLRPRQPISTGGL